MTKNEFKALQAWELVTSRDRRGRVKVLQRVGPTHWRQGLGEKEIFAWFEFIDSKRRVIKTHHEVNRIVYR